MDIKDLEKLYKVYLRSQKVKKYADGSDGPVTADPEDDSTPIDPNDNSQPIDVDAAIAAANAAAQSEQPINSDESSDAEIIRANPDSDKAIEEAAKEEFADKEDGDKKELDRSREPASLKSVEDDEEKTPEEEEEKTKKIEDDLKAQEEADQTVKKDEVESDKTPPKAKYNIDFGNASQNNQSDLAKAQAQRQNMLLGQEMTKYGNLAGAGIAGMHGAKVNPLPSSYFSNPTLANLPVQSFEEQVANQGNDPNSSISKGMRDFIEQKYGMKIAGNPSANDMKAISTQLYNEYAAMAKGAFAEKLLKEKNVNLVGKDAAAAGTGSIAVKAGADTQKAKDIEAAKQPNRIALQNLKNTNAANMFNLRDEAKIKGASVDFYKQFNQMTGRGQALGQAARTSIFADKLPTLINQYKDLNAVPDALVTDANIAFANLISQGVPPANLQALLNKNNLPREPGKIWTWLTANPSGANQKEMLKLLTDSAQKQKQLADAQMKDAAIPVLKGYEFKGMPPEQRKQILKRFNSNEDEYQNWQGGGQFAKVASSPPSPTPTPAPTSAPKAGQASQQSSVSSSDLQDYADKHYNAHDQATLDKSAKFLKSQGISVEGYN